MKSSLRVRNGFLSAVFLFVSTLATAAPDSGLFSPAPEVAGTQRPVAALAGKSRGVQVDQRMLGQGRMRLNLGVGPTLDVVRTRQSEHADGRKAWIGRVSGEPDSDVIFASRGEAVAATIRYRDRLFKLEPAPNGKQLLSEVSPSDPYPEMDPIAAPIEAAGDLASADPVGDALASQGEGDTVVDVLVVYTPAAKARYGGTNGIEALINLAVEETNQAYQNSQVSVRLRLVHTAEVSYTESGNMNTDLNNITGRIDGKMDEVHSLRDTYGADLVSLFEESTDYCGLSWQMASLNPAYATYAFSVIYTQCATGYYSFGHELGHTMGSGHDHANGGGALYPYSYGYQEPGRLFRTVMAYSCTGSCVRVQHFSNPEVNYLGLPTGVADWADNARSLNDAAPTVATWREGLAETPPDAPSGLAAAALSHERIDLTWAENATNEDGIRLERSGDGSDFSEIATLAPNATGFTDTGLAAETTYYYRVAAFNGAGTSASSNDAWATTEPISMVPPTVAILSPAGGAVFAQGVAIGFSGTATDEQDGNLAGRIVWTSDLEGNLGTGGALSRTLARGTHVIEARVTDNSGLSAATTRTVTVVATTSVTLTSAGSQDGWVLEASETSGTGGSIKSSDSSNKALLVGDTNKDQQYRAVLAFDTSAIPAGATIVSATLRLMRGSLSGTNPFDTHGSLLVDVQRGGLGGSSTLEKGDFQALATAAAAASLSKAAANLGWSEGGLNAAGLNAVNRGGYTQMRVYFALDDNDDGGNDYLGYYAGETATAAYRPQLVVTYR